MAFCGLIDRRLNAAIGIRPVRHDGVKRFHLEPVVTLVPYWSGIVRLDVRAIGLHEQGDPIEPYTNKFPPSISTTNRLMELAEERVSLRIGLDVQETLQIFDSRHSVSNSRDEVLFLPTVPNGVKIMPLCGDAGCPEYAELWYFSFRRPGLQDHPLRLTCCNPLVFTKFNPCLFFRADKLSRGKDNGGIEDAIL